MHDFAAAFREAGCPADAEVFHPRDENMDHVYYFSRSASNIMGGLLKKHHAKACQRPQNLAIPVFKVIL
jgi:hypothetical protein